MNTDKQITAIFEKLDSDGDGVFDDVDQCTDTPNGETVDANGCSASQLDSDGDGVFDDVDQCADTPNGETVDANGCSASQLDSDGDGVFDDVDQCGNTPEGDTVDNNGCSSTQIDTDGDGVTDDLDTCSDTVSGETVDAQGCSDSQKDTDGDGVTDNLDQCQNTPSGETVDSFGCSDTQTDADGDTITDDFDLCPNTPTGESVDANGCSDSQKDSDNDGITDDKDQCQNTPSGEGVNSNGCSLSQNDADLDGVLDNLDQCPGTPIGESVDNVGCSDSQRDSDVDGINDDLDLCPNTPTGETVDSNGCSSSQNDSDGDGIYDDNDDCPNTPSGETVNSNGCSASQIDSDEDGIYDNADECPDTIAGELVDGQGCSDSQKDTQPPVVTSITVTDITSTSFKVDWSLDEGSKGYVRFGTSQGVYVGSTNIENNFLTQHIQTVGGNNPAPLIGATTYYWQIYVEDQYGNSGFSEEQTTTTLEEVSKTFVPDDVFEQNLIDQGYDDVLDDYVFTDNIVSVTELALRAILDGRMLPYIEDFTGIQDFASLQELSIEGMKSLTNDMIDLSSNNLRILRFRCTPFRGINLSNNLELEEFTLSGSEPVDICGGFEIIENLDLSNNINFKTLRIGFATIDDLDKTLSLAPTIENLSLGRLGESSSYNGSFAVNLENNVNLRTLGIGEENANFPLYINLKNGANEKLTNISFSNLRGSSLSTCIQADNPSYVESLINPNALNAYNITVTNNCGYGF